MVTTRSASRLSSRRTREARENAFRDMQRVVDATTEIFGGEVRVRSDCDPEHPDDRFIVFEVIVGDGSEAALRLEDEWVRRVTSIVPGIGLFRLSISLDAT